jgi:hypothetical protein
MDAILGFLNRYEILLFILIGAVILVYLRKVFQAWRDWSVALFGLEKELSQRKINQSLSIVIFSGLLGIGLFVINTFVTPSVPGVFIIATPTVASIGDPTLGATPNVTPSIEPTTQGLIPTLSAFLDRGCIPGQLDWVYPQDGGSVGGPVELTVTVNIDDLGFYKIEYRPVTQDTWISIVAENEKTGTTPNTTFWNTADLIPGDYVIRLVAYQVDETMLPECTIDVLIRAVE